MSPEVAEPALALGRLAWALAAMGFMRSMIQAAGLRRQSPGIRDQVTLVRPCWRRISPSQGLRKPKGGRKKRGLAQRICSMAAEQRSNSSRVSRGPQKKRLGWESVWL